MFATTLSRINLTLTLFEFVLIPVRKQCLLQCCFRRIKRWIFWVLLGLNCEIHQNVFYLWLSSKIRKLFGFDISESTFNIHELLAIHLCLPCTAVWRWWKLFSKFCWVRWLDINLQYWDYRNVHSTNSVYALGLSS